MGPAWTGNPFVTILLNSALNTSSPDHDITRTTQETSVPVDAHSHVLSIHNKATHLLANEIFFGPIMIDIIISISISIMMDMEIMIELMASQPPLIVPRSSILAQYTI